MSKLGYLDRPIDLQERTFAEAFITGGAEAETAARAQWKLDVEKKRQEELVTFKAWQEEQKKVREAARAEGRSLITEFTPEEQATRQAEAEAASAAERQMLDIGIGKVAARYWQLEARNATNSSGLSSGGADSLELATAQLVAEQQAQQQSSVTEDGDAVVETAEPVEESEEIPVNSPDETQVVSPAVTESDPEEVEAGQQEGTAESKSDLPVEELTDAALADAAAMLEISEVEMQRIREERVAESFHIYKTQLEERKKGKQPTPPSCRPSTWDTPAPAVPEVERPLYWTEAMDMHLAKLVKSCVFDFDAISTAMQTLAEKDALSSNAALKKPTLLSNEACRLRWAQLDAQQWSEVSPNSTALDTQFKVCISASVLGAGHGAQPTFEALASMAAGSTPAYLKVPTAFPSVQDLVGEESDLDLD